MRCGSTLTFSLGITLLACAMSARAQGRGREHCTYPETDQPWPVVLESQDAPASAVARSDAHRVVAAFWNVWRRDVVPHAGSVVRALAPCMETDRGYYLRRVSGAAAAQRLAALKDAGKADSILSKQPASLSAFDWVWDVSFGGWVDTLRPGGSLGGFVSTDGKLLVAVHWPEG